MALFEKDGCCVKNLRALARLSVSDRPVARPVRDSRGAASRTGLSAARLAELDALIASIAARRRLCRGGVRRAVRPRRSTSLPVRDIVHGRLALSPPPRHGEDRLAQTYEKAGGLFSVRMSAGRLPAVVLEFALDAAAARRRAISSPRSAHICNAIFAALQQRGSPYAAVPGALLELAGETAQPVQIAAEEAIDVAWAEPVVFDGCSAKGQSRPDQPQPIHFVRKDGREGASA